MILRRGKTHAGGILAHTHITKGLWRYHPRTHHTVDHMVPARTARLEPARSMARSAAHLEQACGAQPAVERIAAEVAAYHLALRSLGVEEARAAVQHAVVVDNEALARLQQRS